ncbi:MAG: thioredoxin [Zetaproteobacteria bacterium]|nr:MAG: thioredoxin [Zetaproteobacteria bacterium]
MKYRIIVSSLITLIILAAIIYDVVSVPSQYVEPASGEETSFKGKIAPRFSLTTIHGEVVDRESLKGKIVLLNFWASWCAPCIVEFPAMRRLAEKFDGNVIFLAISIDDNISDVYKFLGKVSEKNSSDFVKIVWDEDKKISAGQFHTVRVPETIIIDKKMMMRRKVVGNPQFWESTEIYEYINGLNDG